MTEIQEDTIHGLPPFLADFARETSVALALRLAANFGGQRKRIPSSAKSGTWLFECVGAEGAAVLAEAYGGELVEIPNASHYHSKKSLIARAEGSNNEVARKFGVTARWVREVRSATRNDDQADLFE